MNVVEETMHRITVSEVPGLDPIRVVLEDIGRGHGRINIECYGTSWACYWGGMGDQTIAQFFVSCDEHYLAGKLSATPSYVFDPDGLRDMLKKIVIKDRRSQEIDADTARDLFDQVSALETFGHCPWHESDLMVRLLGDDWHLAMPEKINPDYEYLCRIIRAVQDALRTMQ